LAVSHLGGIRRGGFAVRLGLCLVGKRLQRSDRSNLVDRRGLGTSCGFLCPGSFLVALRGLICRRRVPAGVRDRALLRRVGEEGSGGVGKGQRTPC
jgi:hypothetical protein